MTPESVRALAEDAAERAADKAVAGVFRLLGVDIADQRQVNEFRADLMHMRRWRRLVERGSAHAFLALLSMIVLGSALLFWDAVKGLLRA